MNENRNSNRVAPQNFNATSLDVETLRSSTAHGAAEAPASGEGGISTFWKIFGGTFLSIAALVFITLCQYFNSSLNELRGDLNHLNGDLRKDLGRFSEAQGELVRKDEFSTRMKSVWDSLKELRDTTTGFLTLKERATLTEQQLKAGEEGHKELAREVQRLREQRAIEDERREMVHELQRLRERLAVLEGRQGAVSGKPAVDGDH
jgi:hypothetical protein